VTKGDIRLLEMYRDFFESFLRGVVDAHFLFRANNRKRLDGGIDANEKFVSLSAIMLPRLRSRTLSVTLSDNVKIIVITQCNGRVNSALE